MAIRRLRAGAVTNNGPVGDAIRFTGDYACWADAQRDSAGYDSAVILQKTREALLKVKRGEAVYERDSVLFDKPEYSFPLLAGLLRAATRSNGRLSVLDFGGSLGSSYFQCRKFLEPVPKLEWSVVEQKAHVDCGRQDFESGQLHFYYTVEECLAQHKPNVLLLSSVLQYLSNPYEMLEQLLRHGINCVIIDRTGFLESDRNRLTVQHVPSSIYPASYPAWFFSETKLLGVIKAAGYDLIAEFDALDRLAPANEQARYKGFIFLRQT